MRFIPVTINDNSINLKQSVGGIEHRKRSEDLHWGDGLPSPPRQSSAIGPGREYEPEQDVPWPSWPCQSTGGTPVAVPLPCRRGLLCKGMACRPLPVNRPPSARAGNTSPNKMCHGHLGHAGARAGRPWHFRYARFASSVFRSEGGGHPGTIQGAPTEWSCLLDVVACGTV
jgi:hypothetical protein